MALILNLRKLDEWRQNRASFGHRQVGIIGKVAVKRQRYTELHKKWIISGNGYYGLSNLKVCQFKSSSTCTEKVERKKNKKKKTYLQASVNMLGQPTFNALNAF